MATERVTITIPRDLLEEADRRASELERSRSWVLAAALRAYLTPDATSRSTVGEPAGEDRSGPGAPRHAQLEVDLTLDPEERVRLAEGTARAAHLLHGPLRRDRVIAFERLEDFYAWEYREAMEP